MALLWRCQAEIPLETKPTNTQGVPESLLYNSVSDLSNRSHQHTHFPKSKTPLQFITGTKYIVFPPAPPPPPAISDLSVFLPDDPWEVWGYWQIDGQSMFRRKAWISVADIKDSAEWMGQTRSINHISMIPLYTVCFKCEKAGMPFFSDCCACFNGNATRTESLCRMLTFEEAAAVAAS